MKVNIIISGKDKEFRTDFISARTFKKMEELQRRQENKEPVELDEIVDFIVQVFNNKFTADEFYDGTDIGDMFPIYIDTCKAITDKFKSKINMFPND